MNRTEKRQQEHRLKHQFTSTKHDLKRLKMNKNVMYCYFCGCKVGNLSVGHLDYLTSCIVFCPQCQKSEKMFIDKYTQFMDKRFVLKLSNNAIGWLNTTTEIAELCLDYKKALNEMNQPIEVYRDTDSAILMEIHKNAKDESTKYVENIRFPAYRNL